MGDSNASGVQINQLNLRVPGRDAQVGHRVANGMAEQLAQQLPPGLKGEFGALTVRVQVGPGASEGEMNEAIAQAILQALQRGARNTMYNNRGRGGQ
ncbi:MAG: hypothetical protein AAGC93_08980 [Cyanobacteria bacterium P01_F01_bin.53]